MRSHPEWINVEMETRRERDLPVALTVHDRCIDRIGEHCITCSAAPRASGVLVSQLQSGSMPACTPFGNARRVTSSSPSVNGADR